MSAVHVLFTVVLLQGGSSGTWKRTARYQLETEKKVAEGEIDSFLVVDQLCSLHTDEPRPSNIHGPHKRNGEWYETVLT
jgi:hypothetical protein